MEKNPTQGQQAVSKDEIRKVASNYLTMQTNNTKILTANEIDTIYEIKQKEKTVIYEVVYKNGNSILLSASKACRPVIGYNLSGKRETIGNAKKDIPDGLLFMLSERQSIISYALSLPDKDTLITNSPYRNDWNSLLNNQQLQLKSTTTATYGPLLTTEWGQRYSNDGEDCNAYNYYITSTSSNCGCTSQRCPAGCVAVAMAQILKYWRYPSYRLLPNFYDWCNMVDKLNIGRPNYDRERNAIALLIKDCGASVDMKYCSDEECSSSAKSPDARDAFINNFSMHYNADYQRRAWHNDNTWIGRIKNNINNGWPVYYRGEGHAFVCDGYKDDNTFHFNWGWAGSYNDLWYSLDDLTPDNENYNSGQGAIFYIYPDGTPPNVCDNAFYIDDQYRKFDMLLRPLFDDIAYTIVPSTYQKLVSASINTSAKWRTIPSGKTGIYEAHKEIILQPGFHAQAGSNFTARITPCALCPQNKSLMIVTPDLDLNISNAEYIDSLYTIQNNHISIYPNPNIGTFWVDIINIQKQTQLLIHGVDGRLLHTQNIVQDKTELNIESYPKGIYFVTIQNQDSKEIFKIIKQ